MILSSFKNSVCNTFPCLLFKIENEQNEDSPSQRHGKTINWLIIKWTLKKTSIYLLWILCKTKKKHCQVAVGYIGDPLNEGEVRDMDLRQ